MRKHLYTITLDDDPTMAKLIEKATGLETVPFLSIEALAGKMNTLDPVAVFVDVHLGTQSGLDWVPKFKAQWPFAPILVITSDSDAATVTQALAAGADDFTMKPFRAAEVKARLQARMSALAQRENQDILRVGDVILNTAHRTLKGHSGVRHLSPTVTNLLRALWEAKGTTVPKDALKWHGWGQNVVSDRALDGKIHELRSVLRESSRELSLENKYSEGFALKIDKTSVVQWRKSEMKRNQSIQENPFFDSKKLTELRELSDESSSDFLIELGENFLSATPEVFQNLSNAVAEKDATKAAALAHKLKGMCFNIGALTLASFCDEIEKKGKRGSIEGAEAYLARYEEAFREASQFLKNLFDKAA